MKRTLVFVACISFISVVFCIKYHSFYFFYNAPTLSQWMTFVDKHGIFTSFILNKLENFHQSKKYPKKVLILCPPGVTGGPENLVQIAKEFEYNGIPTYMIWYDGTVNIHKSKDENGNEYLYYNAPRDLTPDRYKNLYNTKQMKNGDKIPLDESTLVIIPEILTDAAFYFLPAKVIISWLSIPNFFVSGSNNIYKYALKHDDISKVRFLNFAQAQCIEKTLASWKIASIPVYDYISEQYRKNIEVNKLPNTIAYFPNKGGQLASIFKAAHPKYDYKAIQNMTMEQVQIMLKESRVYIDFGHFPGCDRVPREAVLSGCVIFIHNEGCATDSESFPIDDYYRFSDNDVTDGTLSKKVDDALQNFKYHLGKQNHFKKIILNEPSAFKKQIKSFLGTLENDL